VVAHSGNGIRRGTGEGSAIEEVEGYVPFFGGRLHNHAVQVFEGVNGGRDGTSDGLDFGEPGMNLGCSLEVELFGGLCTLPGQLFDEALASCCQKGVDSRGFLGIALVGAALKRSRESLDRERDLRNTGADRRD
jgi:hypothetical protein